MKTYRLFGYHLITDNPSRFADWKLLSSGTWDDCWGKNAQGEQEYELVHEVLHFAGVYASGH